MGNYQKMPIECRKAIRVMARYLLSEEQKQEEPASKYQRKESAAAADKQN